MDKNPYATPVSHVDDPHSTPADVNLFNARGRIGRMRFVSFIFVLIIIFYALFFAMILASGGDNPFEGPTSAKTVVFLILFLGLLGTLAVFYFFYIIKRLHDVNYPGWLGIFVFVPLVNTLLMIYLTFAPGTHGDNNFGAPPPVNSLGVKIAFGFFLLFVALFSIGMLSAMTGLR